MKKYRTLCLLLLAAACGIGSGVFGLMSDELYPALFFAAFPFIVAGLFLSIIYDVLPQRPVNQAARIPGRKEKPISRIPHAA